jgi:predicted nuclease of predicted toxin-antitoxin system
MKLFADEGLDFPIVLALREQGYEVIYAAEIACGAADEILLQKAFSENAILITKDKDFGELVIRRQLPVLILILIRIDQLNLSSNIEIVVNFIVSYEAELKGSFTVIQEDKIRIRKLT